MSASGPGWLWSRLRAREAFNRRTDNVNLNNHREAPGTHSHRGWTHSLSPGCAHLSSGFWMDVTPSPSLLSVSLSHSLPDRRVCPELLLSVEQCPYLWSASVNPSLHAGRAEPRDWQLCTILRQCQHLWQQLHHWEHIPGFATFPCNQLHIPDDAVVWRERQHLPRRAQHPIVQPLAFLQPQFRVLGGMAASAQPTDHLLVHA